MLLSVEEQIAAKHKRINQSICHAVNNFCGSQDGITFKGYQLRGDQGHIQELAKGGIQAP